MKLKSLFFAFVLSISYSPSAHAEVCDPKTEAIALGLGALFASPAPFIGFRGTHEYGIGVGGALNLDHVLVTSEIWAEKKWWNTQYTGFGRSYAFHGCEATSTIVSGGIISGFANPRVMIGLGPGIGAVDHEFGFSPVLKIEFQSEPKYWSGEIIQDWGISGELTPIFVQQQTFFVGEMSIYAHLSITSIFKSRVRSFVGTMVDGAKPGLVGGLSVALVYSNAQEYANDYMQRDFY